MAAYFGPDSGQVNIQSDDFSRWLGQRLRGSYSAGTEAQGPSDPYKVGNLISQFQGNPSTASYTPDDLGLGKAALQQGLINPQQVVKDGLLKGARLDGNTMYFQKPTEEDTSGNLVGGALLAGFGGLAAGAGAGTADLGELGINTDTGVGGMGGFGGTAADTGATVGSTTLGGGAGITETPLSGGAAGGGGSFDVSSIDKAFGLNPQSGLSTAAGGGSNILSSILDPINKALGINMTPGSIAGTALQALFANRAGSQLKDLANQAYARSSILTPDQRAQVQSRLTGLATNPADFMKNDPYVTSLTEQFKRSIPAAVAKSGNPASVIDQSGSQFATAVAGEYNPLIAGLTGTLNPGYAGLASTTPAGTGIMLQNQGGQALGNLFGAQPGSKWSQPFNTGSNTTTPFGTTIG